MIWRMPLTVGWPASSEIDPGSVARIYRLPSSKCGRNSTPSDRTAMPAVTSSNAAPPSVTIRLASANAAAGS